MTDELDRARWEGAIESRVSDAERRLDAINGSITSHAAAVNNLALSVGSLVTRVGIYAAIGSAFSGAGIALGLHFLK